MSVRSIEWLGEGIEGRLRFIDQTLLPGRVVYVETVAAEEVAAAIRSLKVRGAPLIGIAAAFGCVLGVRDYGGADGDGVLRRLDEVCRMLAQTRPTAVNLFHALERVRRAGDAARGAGRDGVVKKVLEEALAIAAEERGMCRRIGEAGLELLRPGMRILTHCNAGALATGGIGTALAPVYRAHAEGYGIKVYVDETRPLLQGSRLTAWELMQAGVEVTVLCDGAAAWAMRRRLVDAVLVGADRIAANGDTANKIGTLAAATAARRYGIPFYVFAPSSTIDPEIENGDGIPIEERPLDAITSWAGVRIAPEGVAVFAPAFDVTPAELISAIVTEEGVLRPPFEGRLPGCGSAKGRN